MKNQKPIHIITLFVLFAISYSPAQKWEVIKSSESELVIHYHFRENETPFQLDETYLPVGLPSENLPQIFINQIETSLYSETGSQKYDFIPTGEYLIWKSKGKFRNLNTGTIKISPLFLSETGNLIQVKKILFTIKFPTVLHTVSGQAGKWELALYQNRIVNWGIAKQWLTSTELQRTFRFDQPITPDTLMDSTLQADHIIIIHGDFTEAAESLANYRISKGMTSLVAKLSVVESDFNSDGDLEGYEAIKAFLQFTFDFWVEPRPAFVLLIGDGPEPMPTHHQNWQNYSSDLRYVYLDPSSSTIPQMAIGRIPVNTLQEAESVIEKTIAYESTPEPGLWRRSVTLVADDFSAPNNITLEKTHITNSESLYVRIPTTLEVNKLYLEEYPAENSGSQTGVVKPDATEALFNILETGTALINYIGHGHPGQWAHEVLLSQSRGDLFSINTGMKLPIWVAGTCSWGQYDSDEGDAMSEDLITDPQNGAIAIISTIEKISYSANEAFIIALFDKLFPNQEISSDPLGAIFLGNQTNDRNEMFHLFGDPALTMAFPTGEVEITEVNPDTLYALTAGSYSGQVSDPSAPSTASGFSLVYEADREVSVPFNNNGTTTMVNYTIPGRTLFRGQMGVENNLYNGSFIIPKDVDYSSLGSFGVYVYEMNNDEMVWEGLGIFDSLYFAGSNTLSNDTQGPIISFFQNSQLGWGDYLSKDAELTIALEDENGINITGETGHSIRLWFDEDENDFIDLTQLFIYDEGEYRSGKIDYTLSSVEFDELFITVEAWDNANNPNQESIKLNLLSSSGLTLNDVFNYPNPFSLSTQFTFKVSEDSEIEIKIYTLNGVLVSTLEPFESYNNFSTIKWDGMDEFGDNIANGVYLYELEATSTVSGKKVSHIGKLAKFR